MSTNRLAEKLEMSKTEMKQMGNMDMSQMGDLAKMMG